METKNARFNNHEQAGGGFDFYDFRAALEKQYGAQKAEFFAMAWREQAGALLEQASRFEKLADWCDKEIRQASIGVNVFSPADKTDDYTKGNAQIWRSSIHYLAELIYFRALLMDNRTTNEQRQNIEYTICKLYGIAYNKTLGDYL